MSRIKSGLINSRSSSWWATTCMIVGTGQLVYGSSSDRKSTRLNSSHLVISYAVFCLKKKNIARHEACAFPHQPARCPRRPPSLGGHVGQRICLIHQLRQLYHAPELISPRSYRITHN